MLMSRQLSFSPCVCSALHSPRDILAKSREPPMFSLARSARSAAICVRSWSTSLSPSLSVRRSTLLQNVYIRKVHRDYSEDVGVKLDYRCWCLNKICSIMKFASGVLLAL